MDQARAAGSGTIAIPLADSPGEVELVNRAIAPVLVGGGIAGYVVGDLPIADEMIQKLQMDTGVRAATAAVVVEQANGSVTNISNKAMATTVAPGTGPRSSERASSFSTYQDWNTGDKRDSASISLSYRPGELYRRLSDAQQIAFRGVPLGVLAIILLLVIAGLFLIIEMVALSMGLALARSITSSMHELFMGTERVRHGDFTHRISVQSNDQLGELAGSFNQMTGSIEGLLQTAAEKKRLEEELRIARADPDVAAARAGRSTCPGSAITALCVPAREVGGDYYDFFPLTDDRLGVLIADVSGKGTSAALYMAELKGLVLALSQHYESPRELLIEVNRIISAQPRQPQLHHHDLCGDRSVGGRR